MKIGTLNIRRGLLKKIDTLEQFANSEKLQILSINESDLGPLDNTPSIPGFSYLRSSGPISRVLLYIRDTVPFDQLIYNGDLPVIVINLAQVTLAFAYSSFTLNPYSNDRIRLTDKDRMNRIMDFLNWLQPLAKENLCLLGDFNIPWSVNSVSKQRITASRSFLYWTCQPNASGNGLQILVPDFLHVGRKPSQYISNASKMPVGIRFTIEYIPRSWKPLIPLAVTSLPV